MLNELAQDIHQINQAHGFAIGPQNFGEQMALIHSEISEALEHYRKGASPIDILWEVDPHSGIRNKPDGIPIELGDVIIRVLGVVGYYGIDIDTAIAEKIAFNRNRPFLHGNKIF